MNFELDEQQQMVRDMVRSFAEERIRPGAAERDRTGEFPHEIFAEMGELGLLGMMVPEDFGGAFQYMQALHGEIAWDHPGYDPELFEPEKVDFTPKKKRNR